MSNGAIIFHEGKGLLPSLGEALVVDDDPVVLSILEKALTGFGYLVTTATNAASALRRMERSVPEVIVTDILMPGMNGKTFCRKIRKNPKTSGVPIIMMSTATQLEERLQGFRAGADDYITKPFQMREVKARMDRLVLRNRRALSSNPLSGLPGNPTIEVEGTRRLAENKPFAFAYIDIDDFKSYNDVYGYQSGDRVLKDLSRMLVKAANAVCSDAFVGHVGGDDFVIMSSAVEMRAILKIVLKTFDRETGGYYSSGDKQRGGVVTSNRQYRKQFFPLMKLSCAVIDTAIRKIHHYAELVEIATELKHHLKSQTHRRSSLAQWNGRLDTKKLKIGPLLMIGMVAAMASLLGADSSLPSAQMEKNEQQLGEMQANRRRDSVHIQQTEQEIRRGTAEMSGHDVQLSQDIQDLKTIESQVTAGKKQKQLTHQSYKNAMQRYGAEDPKTASAQQRMNASQEAMPPLLESRRAMKKNVHEGGRLVHNDKTVLSIQKRTMASDARYIAAADRRIEAKEKTIADEK